MPDTYADLRWEAGHDDVWRPVSPKRLAALLAERDALAAGIENLRSCASDESVCFGLDRRTGEKLAYLLTAALSAEAGDTDDA
jgi:hypothetical protein